MHECESSESWPFDCVMCVSDMQQVEKEEETGDKRRRGKNETGFEQQYETVTLQHRHDENDSRFD